MRRSFGFDVLACPRCGERLWLIALIEEASVIELGLPTEIPEPCPARASPLPLDARAPHVGGDVPALDPAGRRAESGSPEVRPPPVRAPSR